MVLEVEEVGHVMEMDNVAVQICSGLMNKVLLRFNIEVEREQLNRFCGYIIRNRNTPIQVIVDHWENILSFAKEIIEIFVHICLYSANVLAIGTSINLVVTMYMNERNGNHISLDKTWETFVETRDYLLTGNFEDGNYETNLRRLKRAIEELRHHPDIKNHSLAKKLGFCGLISICLGAITGLLVSNVAAVVTGTIGVVSIFWGVRKWWHYGSKNFTLNNDGYVSVFSRHFDTIIGELRRRGEHEQATELEQLLAETTTTWGTSIFFSLTRMAPPRVAATGVQALV